MSAGTHTWFMTNLRAGYLVVEGCPDCGARSSFFSAEHVPPVDDYQDGRHHWIYMGSFQTVRFDLQCSDCGKIVNLGDMVGLMLSTCNDPDCKVGNIVRQQGEGSWVYVALCANSTHAQGKCVSDEGIEAISQYFNQGIDALDRKFAVVPCKLCNSIDKCKGTFIADVGLTDMYSDTAHEPRRSDRGRTGGTE